MRRSHSLALAAALALSGCGGGGSDSGFGIPGSATQRSFSRTDGMVTTLPGVGGFTATRVVTLANDRGGATAGVLSLLNENGDVTSAGDTQASGYQVQVTLRASAPTEQQAIDALDTMTVRHVDALGGGTLYIDHEVEYAPFQQNGVSRSATVAATFPALSSRLRQRTVNGTVGSGSMTGTLVLLDSTNGDVVLDGTWDQVELATVSGSVTASSQPFLGDSHATMRATNGDIQVTVPAGNPCPISGCPGFDLKGQTTNGSVTINVDGAEPVGNQGTRHRHHRSPGYSGSDPKVSVDALTVNGDVVIQD